MNLLKLVIYTAIMVLSIYLGKKGFLKRYIQNYIGTIQVVLVMILLFVMGMILGKDREVIESLSKIGIKAFIMTLSIVIFSVLTLTLFKRLYIKIVKIKTRPIKRKVDK